MIRMKRKDITNGSEVNEEYRHTPKKLKLIIRERNIYSVLDELEKAGDINTAITLLFEIGSFYPLKSKDAELIFQRLLQKFRLLSPANRTSVSAIADESAWVDVKLKIIEILRTISKMDWLTFQTSSGSITPSSTPESPDGLMNQILDHISDEDEPECVTVLLTLVYDFQHYLPSCESAAFKRMLSVCRQSLTDQLWSVRTTALRLLTLSTLRQRQMRRENQPNDPNATANISFNQTTSFGPVSVDDLENILCVSTEDSDSRVRAAAAEALLEVCKNGWTLPRQHYQVVCRLSKDSAEHVRLLGLRLIHIYASTSAYVDTMEVSGLNQDVEIRLIDHAFSALCNAMHDLSVAVRTEAAALLGTLKDVSEKFLKQTLDKKLMSKMRFKKQAGFTRFGQQQQQGGGGQSEWSTGRKFGEDAPMEKAEEDSESLMPSGACGAFVTGLEDEYLSVRNASIDAVSNLAADCPSFAQNALDFLADMFNDEIEEVRLNAIKSLRRLCSHIVLKIDQMEIILNALDDASPDSREALRELLCICTMADVRCLNMTVDALLKNIKRFPIDRQSVWRCMKWLGNNHAELAVSMVGDLLDLHPFFQTNEPALDDFCYITKLVLVLNIAARCPSIKKLFLGHTWRHYHYLRCSNPHLVPNLDETESSSIVLDKNAILGSTDQTLSRCQNLLASVVKLSGDAKWEVTKLVIKDLKRLANSIFITNDDEDDNDEGDMATTSVINARWRAECLRFCAENVTKLEKILHRLTMDEQLFDNSILSGFQIPSSLVDELKEILKNSFSLEQLWKTTISSGDMDSEDKYGITTLACDLRLRATAALMAVDIDVGNGHRWLSLFVTTLQRMTKLFPNENWISDLSALEKDLSEENASAKAKEIINRLINVPLNAALKGETGAFTTAVLRRKRAVIVEPDKDNDTIIKFVAGLAAAINLTANFYDLDENDLTNIQIRVVYPDQREEFIKPRLSHFRRVSSSIYRLRTEVLVSDCAWSDAANIDLSLVYRLPTDMISGGGQYENENYDLNWVNLDTEDNVGVSLKIFPKSRC